MGFLFTALAGLCGLGSLICFIMVVIQIFKAGQTGLGIACIVLIFCGIGGLIAFVYGWMKSAEWDIKNIMLGWTGCIVGGIVFQILAAVMAGGAAGG